MSGARCLGTQILGFITTVLVANVMFANAAAGQISPSELPAKCSAYGSIPLPAEAGNVQAPKKPPACASYRSYMGIGRPVNYSEARACAWRERLAQQADLGQSEKEPDAWVVGGPLILADIYFNGAGVKRNIPLAMRFACEFEEGAAMLALPDIKKLLRSPHARGRLEFCDYAATTFTMNFCQDYESQIDDDRRARYYSSLKASMTPVERLAFERLLSAETAYIRAHALEVDQGGTIRDIRTLGSQSILEDLFHTELIHFERKEWPKLSKRQTAAADALERREYERKLRKLRGQTKDAIDEGAVTADHLASVEKSWRLYREAWVAFARVRYPDAVAPIRAEITFRRYLLLKSIYAY